MVYPSLSHISRTLSTLLTLLPPTELSKPQILFLAGESTGYRHDTDRELSFRQESNFFYLTGCDIPGSFLLVAFQKGTGLEDNPSVKLFIPPVREADLMWSVPPPSLNAAKEMYLGQVTSVHHSTELVSGIQELLKAFPDGMFHTLPRASPLFPKTNEEAIEKVMTSQDAGITDSFLLPALHRTRILKSPSEIALIRTANGISSRAHETIMRVLGSSFRTPTPSRGNTPLLPSEWRIEREAEAEAIFVASCRREGAVHQAYLPICASNTRAATLHYCCNDKEFAWGPPPTHSHSQPLSATSVLTNGIAREGPRTLTPQLILLDAGCEHSNYASDITRTLPIGNGGRFTPPAARIYDLVWEMQRSAFGMLKPGVEWKEVHMQCHRVLIRGFWKLGIFRDPNGERPELRREETDESVDIVIEAPESHPAPVKEEHHPPPQTQTGNDIPESLFTTLLQTNLSTFFFPHGLGHSLGLDVHDVPSASRPSGTVDEGDPYMKYLRLTIPLEAGMVVTVEPGIYFHEHLLKGVKGSKWVDHDVLAQYIPIGGVRIEDVVHITADGYENLTTVRSERAWVEGVCSGER